MKHYYVYILKCSDESYYTGVTNDLEKRFAEHQSGDDPKSYVFKRRPLKLVWSECYNDINQAIEKEKQIKDWTRKKKEALINEDYDELVELSKNSILRQAQDDILRQSFDRKKSVTLSLSKATFYRKIVITGPESSGKTTLAKLLAKEYDAALVNEYAREYLSTLRQHFDKLSVTKGENPYRLEDVLIMAKEQLRLEQSSTSELTFLDTDLTVFAIWIKEKYNQEIDWINNHLKKSKDKIYLLCDIDIEWEEDGLREHPKLEDRKRLFDEYVNLLEKYQLPYHVISGDIPSRIKKCKEIIG